MKFLKRVVVVLVILGLLGYFVGMPYMQKQTKKHSPERTSTYAEKGMDIAINYSSPSKKNRVIFGELVPFDTVWRTGANEPTTFSTKTDLTIGGKTLPAGTYSLWTKPNPEKWLVMFNSEVPDWGVTILSGGTDTTRNAALDVVTIEVPVLAQAKDVEKFTIAFQETNGTEMCLLWDKTKITVPISK